MSWVGFFDLVRWVLILGIGGVAGISIALLLRKEIAGNVRLWVAGLIIFALSGVVDQMGRLGMPPSYRLVLYPIGLVLSGLGAWRVWEGTERRRRRSDASKFINGNGEKEERDD